MNNEKLAIAFFCNASVFGVTGTEQLEAVFDAEGLPAIEFMMRLIPGLWCASHAAELYLKSKLLQVGVSEQELKKRHVRHDLEALNGLVMEKVEGWQLTENSLSTLSVISTAHSAMALRYGVFVPDLAIRFPHLSAVKVLLGELRSVARENLPQGGLVEWEKASTAIYN